MITAVTGAAVVGLAAAAIWYDVRERRLPNLLTLGGLAVALALRAPMGLESIGSGLAGAGVAFGLALPFFIVGGAGAGDVKLLTAVGAFVGWSQLDTALFVMAMVGGVMAVTAILRRRAVRQTFVNLQLLAMTFGRRSFTGWKGAEGQAALTLETPGAITVPYGVAIAAGALAGWFLT